MSILIESIQTVHQAGIFPAAPSPNGGGGGMSNPFSDIVPDFSVLGADFNSKWKKIFAAFWFGCLIIGGAYVLRGFVVMNQHKGSNHPHELAQARSDLNKAALAFAGMVAFNTIIGALIFLVS